MDAAKNTYSFLMQLTQDAVVLTPNRRLAANLHKQYAALQINSANPCWPTPRILPLASWIKQLWVEVASKEFNELPMLLSLHQERFIWEEIISNSSPIVLLRASETADKVHAAWQLINQWQLNLSDEAFHATEDYISLKRWARTFEDTCKKNNWLSESVLPSVLQTHYSDIVTESARKIILFGFNDLPPQLHSLLSLSKQPIEWIDAVVDSSPKLVRVDAKDPDDEHLQMANWAYTLASDNPHLRIGCVLPNLDKIRDRVWQIFNEVFSKRTSAPINFNLSAGKPLTKYPIINTAFQLLQLNRKTISIERLSALLTSAFIGESESEYLSRCKYDRLLKENNFHQILLVELVNDAEKTNLKFSHYCPKLVKRLRDFFHSVNKIETTLTYSKIVETFMELLTLLGWPGERSLNSEEYQVVEHWLQILQEFKLFDCLGSETSYTKALQQLMQISSKTIFQAQSPEVNVQVLGILEAASLPFDYVWIAGMDDLSWPPAPKPNPFIPKSLQRELQMPHATALREYHYCQNIIKQFKNSVNNLIFSVPHKVDGLEREVSPLIKDIPLLPITELYSQDISGRNSQVYDSKLIETFEDNSGPPIDPNETIRGGISVLKQQALCPFKAFAEWRLHAHDIPLPLPGFKATERGTLVHAILEKVWQELKDHATLISLSDSELQNVVNTSIQTALKNLLQAGFSRPRYLALEITRLERLILDWLAVEKMRSPFKVSAFEKKFIIDLNQLKLSVRIDRIDELEDGKKLIVDYKTGKTNSITHWFSDRPEEPQLPLYALQDTDATVGISFAQVSPGNHTFIGVSHYDVSVQGIKPITAVKKQGKDWHEQLNEWHHTLQQLSADFAAGKANVDPKNKTETCNWCALQSFCRVDDIC